MKNSFEIKVILNSVVLTMLGILAVVFSALYVNTFNSGFFYVNKSTVLTVITVSVCILTVLAISFFTSDNVFVFKLTLIVLSLVALATLTVYLLKITGLSEKINSIEELRAYVSSFGYMAVVIYIIMNILQVVVLPIPGFIAVGTGVALFGPLKTAIYSFIGITIGSLIAFFIGRILGYKVVRWLVGKETLDKWLKKVKNKDKVVLTFMFLFPFFPDDVLCFIAGLSTMSTKYFIIMIAVCRIISVIVTSYSINGSIIPFNTWWGIMIWGIILALTVSITVLLYKKGDKIEKFFKKKFKTKSKKIA